MGVMTEKTSSRRRGWLALGLAVIVGMAAVMALNLKRGLDAELGNAATHSRHIAHAVAQHAAASLQKTDLLLGQLIDAFSPGEGEKWFEAPKVAGRSPKLRLAQPEIQSLRLIRADGHAVYTLMDGGAGVSALFPGDESFFAAHRDNANLGLTLTGPSPGQAGSSGHFVLSRRLNHPDGGFAGVAAATVSLSHVEGLFAGFNAGKNASLTLLDGNLAVLARFPAGEAFLGKSLRGSQLETHLREAADGRAYAGISSLDGVERISSVVRAGDFPLYVEAGLARRIVLDAWSRHALINGTVVLALSAAVLFLSVSAARRGDSAREHGKKRLPAPLAGGGETQQAPHPQASAPAEDGEEALRSQNETLQERLAEAQAKIESDRAQSLATIALLRKRADESLSQCRENVARQVVDETARAVAREREAMRQARLAAMSEVIGNVAHLWRQPLNKLDLLLADIKVAQKFHELDPRQLLQSTQEGRQIIRDMLFTVDEFRNFFMPGKQRVALNLADELRATLEILSVSLRESGIEVCIDAGEEIVAWGFPKEYSQVLLNILGNARDALLDNAVKDGVIRIQVSRDDEHAHVAVSDNAGGIPENILEKIFEPDFATRRKGAGIGLFMSKIIMEDGMNGKIAARNIAGGAEFIISCPLAKAS
jgi:signal transduction histidine kinase